MEKLQQPSEHSASQTITGIDRFGYAYDRSRYKIIGQPRLTKETVLSVLDLEGNKSPLEAPSEIAQKMSAIPFLTTVGRHVARYKMIVDRKLTERSAVATLSIQ